MLVKIESFWKPEDEIFPENNLFYLESTIGRIYSPAKFLFRNFYTGATITEEKLLATLASYDLKYCNNQLYKKLVERIAKHTPQYIVNELLIFGETTSAIKNLYQEEEIYHAIKDDSVCRYLYFDEYYFRHHTYQSLKQNPKLEEWTFYQASTDISVKKQVNRFNFMGVAYYNNTDFLIRQLDNSKIDDQEIKNYLLPHLPESIKNDPKLWLHLISLPESFLSITEEEFRIEHFEEYKRKNKRIRDIELFYQSLSPETRIKYMDLFAEIKFTKKFLNQLEKQIITPSKPTIEKSSSQKNDLNLEPSPATSPKVPLTQEISIKTTTKSKLKKMLDSLPKSDLIFSSSMIMQELIEKDPNFIKYISLSLLRNKDFILKNIQHLSYLKSRTGIETVKENGEIAIYPTSLPIYKFNYEWHEWNPTGLSLSKNCLQKRKTNLEEYEYLFLQYGYLLKPIYIKYYPQYKKLLMKKNLEKQELKRKDNFLDFISVLLLNPKNFDMIYLDSEISIVTFNLLRRMLVLLKPETSPQLKHQMLQKREAELREYNKIVNDYLNGKNTIINLTEKGLSKEELIASIMKIKSLYTKEKETLLRLLLETKYILTVKDIIYLLEEMKENKMTIDEILQVHEIPKSKFYKIYRESLTQNPILFELIQNYLNQNKIKGIFKLKSLAHYIIGLNPKTEAEFKQKFPNYEIEKLSNDLERLGESTLSNSLQKIMENWNSPKIRTLKNGST